MVHFLLFAILAAALGPNAQPARSRRVEIVARGIGGFLDPGGIRSGIVESEANPVLSSMPHQLRHGNLLHGT